MSTATRLMAYSLTTLTLVASLTAGKAHACAGCSNPNLPATRAGGAEAKAGEVSVGLLSTGTLVQIVHTEACPDIGPICAVRDEPPQVHEQQLTVGELRALFDASLSETFGLELQVPLRATRVAITYRRLDGTAFEPDYVNIHHRNETLLGLGDPWLWARGAWQLSGFRIAGRAGLTLPLGRTEADPFALAEAGQSHQHVQFGTGTANPLLALDVSRQLGPVRASAYGQAMLVLADNAQGFRAGHRLVGGVSGDVVLWRGLTGSLGVDVLREEAERWQGMVHEEGNAGRTDLLVGGGVSYAAGPWSLALSVKAPVWQHFDHALHTHGDGAEPESQLTYPAVVGLVVRLRTGG